MARSRRQATATVTAATADGVDARLLAAPASTSSSSSALAEAFSEGEGEGGGGEPLYALEACNRGNVQFLKDVLAAGASAMDRDPATGNVALHLAAKGGHEACVELLLSQKLCPVDVRNKHGNTPLHHSAISGSRIVTKMLLDAGADINAVNVMGQTPLHGATGQAWDHVIEFMAAYSRPESDATETKPSNADVTKNRKPAKDKLDMNVRDDKGRTVLHYTAKHMSASTWDLLIRLGADPTIPDNKGVLPRSPRERWRELLLIRGPILVAVLIAVIAFVYPYLEDMMVEDYYRP